MIKITNRREAGKFAFAGAAAMAAFYGAPTAALAEEAALGPVLAVVTHPVADCAAWRAVYDEVVPLRLAAGVTGAEVFTDATNPLMIVILHRFATMDAAQAFFANPDLAAAMKSGGVTAPPTVILSNAT
jgi:quinol monooxygenase YgiN